MRFALAVISAAFSVLSVGCSDAVPATPDGAWFVSTTQSDPLKCHIAGHNAQVGQVDASNRINVETDGVSGAAVSCTVAGMGKFSVNASASKETESLQIIIDSITSKATQASPATGSVSYLSKQTVVVYQGNCDFYFLPMTPEAVSEGKIWVAFSCDEITNGGTMSTCELKQGYAIFESCLTTTE